MSGCLRHETSRTISSANTTQFARIGKKIMAVSKNSLRNVTNELHILLSCHVELSR